jgi:hypothetical protein
MSDDTTSYGANDPAGAPGESADRVGFCQNCGKPLTKETARPVGGGVFCEPCLAARLGVPLSTPGASAGNAAGTPYATAPSGEPLSGSLPHPTLAALLALIPGVGAVYNGQYAKGLAHFVILMVLSSMGNHVSGIFHVAALIWWVYQIVDAYQTAKARLEGHPLPNPFGLNEIGDRLGFGKTPNSTTVPPAAAWQSAPATPPPAGTPYPASDFTAAGYSPVHHGPPVTQGPDWVGYVPPEHFAAPPVMPPPSAAQGTGAWGQAPYASTFTGGQGYSDAQVPIVPVPPQSRRFPIGAIWLIALGVLFLLAEFTRDWGWSVSPNWVLAILFAGLAGVSLMRRAQSGTSLVAGLRWPVTLGVLAFLFVLQALDIANLGRTWPVLFIAMGAMLILERAAHANMPYVPPVYPPTGVPPNATAEAQAERVRATWGDSPTHGGTDDSTKGGL